jgi:hypothetical protein
MDIMLTSTQYSANIHKIVFTPTLRLKKNLITKIIINKFGYNTFFYDLNKKKDSLIITKIGKSSISINKSCYNTRTFFFIQKKFKVI